MTSESNEDAETVLSDVDSDEPSPVVALIDHPPREDAQRDERLTELIAELDRERKAREAAESSKSEIQASFNRLKALAHEVIKKREELKRERDEALKEKERLSKELESVIKGRDDVSLKLNEVIRDRDCLRGEIESVSKSKDDVSLKLGEVVRERDGLKGEIESSCHMLVSGIEKISNKVSIFKSFSGLLPKSQKYTGLASSVAYGVIKRANEIVEELVRQRNEAREEMDQRNYEIAIEVSQLESAICNLRLEVAEKASVVDDLERDVSGRDKRIGELEKDRLEKVSEVVELKELVDEYDGKLKAMGAQRPLLVEQLNLVSRVHEQLYEVVRVVDVNSSEQSGLSESFFMPRETEMEENVRASLAGMESIFELTKVVSGKTQSLVEEKSREVKNLNETVGLLVKEKEQIGTLLRSALSKRMMTEQLSGKSELFQAAENGLRDVGVDLKSTKPLKDGKVQDTRDDSTVDDHSTDENEIYSLTTTLENIVKASQLKIVELQHSLQESSEETSSVRKQLDSQTKELNQRIRQIEELKEKGRIANENVEGLMTDIAAAEEEIARWKVAAEQEAAAGGAVEQDFTSQLHVLKEELEEAKQAIIESEKKLKFKEETAAAAMGARDAAERSLRLADNRAARLRERIQELNGKVEELETHRDMNSSNRGRYVCWPWQFLGIDIVGGQRVESEQQSSNEMELAEPLL